MGVLSVDMKLKSTYGLRPSLLSNLPFHFLAEHFLFDSLVDPQTKRQVYIHFYTNRSIYLLDIYEMITLISHNTQFEMFKLITTK